MKKWLFVALLINGMFYANAQSSQKTCTAFKELVKLASADNLYGLAVDSFASQYMKPLFGMELSKSTKNLPDAVESFVALDRSTGATYNAYLYDYGTDGVSARKDFPKVVEMYRACLPEAQLKFTDEETAFIYTNDCKVKMHVYECSWTNTWTTYITIQHR